MRLAGDQTPVPSPRPLHIAVVQGNLPAVHRLVSLFQHGGRELDTYNNLRQVSRACTLGWEMRSLGVRTEGLGFLGCEGAEGASGSGGSLDLREQGLGEPCA